MGEREERLDSSSSRSLESLSGESERRLELGVGREDRERTMF